MSAPLYDVSFERQNFRSTALCSTCSCIISLMSLDCTFNHEKQQYVWMQVYFHWGISPAFALHRMEASLMPQQGHVCWICPGSRVSIDIVLPCKRMMQGDLSRVKVALFLSSHIGIELPSLALKLVKHVDWQFYQAVVLKVDSFTQRASQ